jgi:hypothetical protein
VHVKRICTGAITLLVLTIGALGVSAGTAGASAAAAGVPFANCSGVTGNTTSGAAQLEPGLSLTSGSFSPGKTGEVHIAGAQAGKTYNGIVSAATPISLQPQAATAAGHLNYAFAVPANFEVGTVHHITLYRDGVRVGNFDFCVVKPGNMAPTTAGCTDTAAAGGNVGAAGGNVGAAGGSLAKTGVDHLKQVALWGAVVLLTGISALYARKRLHTTPAAY